MVYDQIRYVDEAGWEVVRVNYGSGRPAAVSPEALQLKSNRYYFKETLALGMGEVYVSPMDLNMEHGQVEKPHKPMIRLSTPVFNNEGQKRGILVLNYMGARLIAEVKAISESYPGTAMLLGPNGRSLLDSNPEAELGIRLEGGRILTPVDTRAAGVSVADQGQFQTANGLFTYQTLWRSAHMHKAAGSTYVPVEANRRDNPANNRLATIVLHVPNHALYPRSDEALRKFLLIYAIVITLLGVLAWRVAYTSAVRIKSQEKLQESETRLRSLSSRLITAQEEERRSISRDLHDDLGQLVTSISLDLERVGPKLQGKHQALIHRALDATECLLGRVQDISSRLRPSILDDLGLKDAVQSYMAKFELETGIDAQVRLRFDRNDIPGDVSECVFRILQEALTNVVKHAQARTVSVRMEVSNNAITLVIGDDGMGFRTELSRKRTLGVLGMRERTELLNGTFSMRSKPGNGTKISVCIPINHA